MLSLCLLILTLNIDALSYGSAYGLKNKIIPLPWILFISTISTVLFLIPLYLSRFIYQYFDEKVLKIINGLVLILLGIKYCFEKQTKNITPNFNLKRCFIECFIISVDAIFTAILSGFTVDFFEFSIFFYFLTNFAAIFCGNRFCYKTNKFLGINLNILSGFLFIFLGIIKIASL